MISLIPLAVPLTSFKLYIFLVWLYGFMACDVKVKQRLCISAIILSNVAHAVPVSLTKGKLKIDWFDYCSSWGEYVLIIILPLIHTYYE